MDRESLRQLGLTDEQIEAVMKSHGQSTQNLQSQIAQSNLEMARLRGVEAEYNTFKAQKSKGESKKPENPEVLEAQRQIAELKAEMNRKDIAVYASAKGLTGEQAENVLKAFGTDVELAKSAIDSISQIISDSNKTAIADFEKQNLKDTPNPDGTTGNGSTDDTPADLKNAESITFGGLSENAQTARDYYK